MYSTRIFTKNKNLQYTFTFFDKNIFIYTTKKHLEFVLKFRNLLNIYTTLILKIHDKCSCTVYLDK